MEKNQTLQELFEAQKESIKQKMCGIQLPRDTQLIQSIISDSFNDLFAYDSHYRQTLTKSEDFIFQSALGLISAQQQLLGLYPTSLPKSNSCPVSETPPEPESKSSDIPQETTEGPSPLKVLAGTAIGSAVGGAVGTWGAVLGAIGGAALVLYIAKPKHITSSDKHVTPPSNMLEADIPPISTPSSNEQDNQEFDADSFLNIMSDICKSIDQLMKTSRVQIQRLRDSYEQQSQVTLSNSFPELVKALEGLFGSIDSDEENEEDLQLHLQLLKRSLKNYNIFFEQGRLIQK